MGITMLQLSPSGTIRSLRLRGRCGLDSERRFEKPDGPHEDQADAEERGDLVGGGETAAADGASLR